MSRSPGRRPAPSPVRRPGRRLARTGAGAAAALYAANCALGTAVGLRLVDTSRVHWVHHALYGVVVAGAAGAVALGAAAGSRTAPLLAPALVPLGVLPRVRAPSRGHVLLAASAAPAYLLALRAAASERAADRTPTAPRRR
ncbi:hypothetical protein [uncultured Pseudokineococcus sp.]|uniref:hypothetical protein n=1 Tax=uncultured Pseudokineococcus sp. TaxID=1642928 RepID=UPI00262220BA|nr:hypothetical protein [uncultured Pseudokineococcus sp.]